MINVKTISQEIEKLLSTYLEGYIIQRNERENKNPNLAAKEKGWIGIYRDTQEIETHQIGSTGTWLSHITMVLHLQGASIKSGADAEDKLQDAEQEIMNVLADRDNLTLNGSVNMVTGFNIRYEFDVDNNIYFHSAYITLIAQVQSNA